MKHMKKAGLVAAIAVLGLPLAAQADTSVTLYGKLYPQVVYGKVSSPSDESSSDLTRHVGNADGDYSGTGMSSSNSHFGLRGTEELGGNLRAIFQLETKVGVHDGSGNGWSRNTFVGLQSDDWGTLKLGQMDTPYKEVGDAVSFLGVSSGNFVSNATVLSSAGFDGGKASSFHLRRGNAIMYESPEVGGFQFLAQYSKGDSDAAINYNSDDPWVLSTAIKYENGPLYLALAYEHHRNLYGGSLGTGIGGAVTNKESKDQAIRLTAGYRFSKSTRVGADFAHLRWKESGGAIGDFEEYRHNTWALNVQHKIGAATLQASYAQGTAGSCTLVGVDCDASGLQARQFNIGASYALSKRTFLFAIASKLVNGDSARLNNLAVKGKVSPGADITQVAVGLSHAF